MSIPKQPRQLMINLMYLVLTALLALNVSAEIMNAFNNIDESMNKSASLLGQTNEIIINEIYKQADVYDRYIPLKEKANHTMKETASFISLIDLIKDRIINESGGLLPDGNPKNNRDKDTPSRILINEREAYKLETAILSLRNSYLKLAGNDNQSLSDKLPLNLSKVPTNAKTKDWAVYNFRQMPVAAVLPILSKYQNDAKVSETVILNHLLTQTGAEIKPDQFIPIISMEKSYLTTGETFKGVITLAAYSSTADNITISVDGRPLNIDNGKAYFEETARSIGKKKHHLKINLTNPLSDEEQEFEKEFYYEVGEKSATVAADKMNVMYVGVDNPLSISVAGVPSHRTVVRADGTPLQHLSGSKYMARPTTTGRAKIKISAPGMAEEVFEYRIKRIPDPTPSLSGNTGGNIKAAEFRVQEGIYPELKDFDFDARCKVIGFEMVRVPKSGDAQMVLNNGGKFNSVVKQLVQKAKARDRYYFDNIKAKCPGDVHSRKLNSMVFNIK